MINNVENYMESKEKLCYNNLNKKMVNNMYKKNLYQFIEKEIKQIDLNPCVKQTVGALIHTKNNEEIFGMNGIKKKKIIECPRVIQNMKTGEGYHLCKEICHQVSHAEVEAIKRSKQKNINIEDSTLYLIGHTYCCDDCLKQMTINRIKEVYILDKNDKIIKYYDLTEF
jgi:deoxycytidylate deaminase